jgi:hypothetical protein
MEIQEMQPFCFDYDTVYFMYLIIFGEEGGT